jgi:phage baseplate assembly protein W
MSPPPTTTTGVDHPFHVDGRGRTATADGADHLRDLIEAVLFTAPGERVMRPDFGSGLLGLLFEPGGPELTGTVQFMVQSALARWLGNLISVEEVEVDQDDGVLTVEVRYVVVASRTAGTATITRRTPT